ncbi:response regulator, partial [Roseibium sp.]|uniref:response regulator n=1 Tax=Roseibium sp. TaxID=1936156 RepID=UPI003296F454
MRPGVLIVDDDAIVRSVWAKLLEDNGFSTVEAKDGIEAIEKLSAAQEGIHVILLDRMMPRMTGDEFLKHIINTHRCHVSVIMIT